MLLIIGNSYAAHLQWRVEHCVEGYGWRSIVAMGWRGAHLNNDQYRRWVIAEARRLRPHQVLLIAGGNDLAEVVAEDRRAGLRRDRQLLGVALRF